MSGLDYPRNFDSTRILTVLGFRLLVLSHNLAIKEPMHRLLLLRPLFSDVASSDQPAMSVLQTHA
jgi:hypothetical protein